MLFKFRVICGFSVLLALSAQSVFASAEPPSGEGSKTRGEISFKSSQAERDRWYAADNEVLRVKLQGDAFLKEGYVDYAIEAYTKYFAMTSPIKSLYAFAGLADAQARKGLFKEAEANYRISVGLDPDPYLGVVREGEGDLQMRFALLLSKMGKVDEAIQMYQWGGKCLDIQDKKFLDLPFSAKKFDKPLLEAAAHTALGQEYASHGNYEDAVAEFRQAVALKPDFALAQYHLGYTLRSQGLSSDVAESRAAFKKAEELDKGEIRERAIKALSKNR